MYFEGKCVESGHCICYHKIIYNKEIVNFKREIIKGKWGGIIYVLWRKGKIASIQKRRY